MTRFARAKGSKASNERREEEATPWHVMRQQLAEQLSNYQAGVDSESNTSYNLKEILSNGTNTQHEEVWSDFGETKSNSKKQLKPNREKNYKEEFKIKETKINSHDKDFTVLSEGGRNEVNVDSIKTSVVEETNEAKERGFHREGNCEKKTLLHASNKSVEKKPAKTSVSSGGIEFVVESIETSNVSVKTKKVDERADQIEAKFNGKKRKFQNIKNNEIESGELGVSKRGKNKRCCNGKNIFVETYVEPKDEFQSSTGTFTAKCKNIESTVEFEKPEQKKNKKPKKSVERSSTEVVNSENNVDELQGPNENPTNTFNSLSNEEKSSEVHKSGNFRSDKNKQSNYSENNNKPSNNSYKNNFHQNNFQKNNFSKYEQERTSQTIIANGREIHIVKYDGFFVKKEDAVELKNLRKKLLAKKIPKEKLKIIMKLERRKAEKALAREKKKVCYHCRQFGHNFSDCPEIKASDVVKTGMCFKCGSLEHSHFECKVLQRQEFRHAVCFVCKEQGHIARQCPLNSQGQYPKGGSCHLCGEVTHLRKDCPKAVEEKTNKSVTVDTLKGGQVEDMGGKMLKQKEIEPKKKKVIKFT